MSQVNLLPPEVRQRSAARNQAIVIGIAGAVLVGILFIFYLLAGVSLAKVNNDLAAQEAVNAGLEGQVQDLLPYEELEAELKASEEVVDEALAYEVSWSSVLRDVQLSMTDQMALTSFTGSVAPDPNDTEIIGTLDISQTTQGSLRIARWLSKLGQIDSWSDPWVASATKNEGDRWDSSTTINLLITAATPRGQAGAKASAG